MSQHSNLAAFYLILTLVGLCGIIFPIISDQFPIWWIFIGIAAFIVLFLIAGPNKKPISPPYIIIPNS